MSRSRSSAIPLWASSALFALLVLGGHDALGSRGFLGLVLAAAVVHVLVVARFHARFSAAFFLSQSLIVVTTVASVVAYLLSAVGPVSGIGGAVLWHLAGSWTAPTAYVDFGQYLVTFGAAYAVLGLLIWRVWPRCVGLEPFLASLYAASAVNVACCYVLRRPLFQVSGDPDATLFFFLAGLVGLEFSVLLHLLVLAGCLWFAWAARRGAARRGARRM